MKNQKSKFTLAFLPFLCFLIISANALPKKPKKSGSSPINFAQVEQLANADSLRLVEIFKDLHQHPEIAFTEKRTAAIIAKELNALKFDVMTGIGKTGVVGILRNGAGPTVMFRADMDGLPMKEKTSLPYASKDSTIRNGEKLPVMHACGHDAHVTWMLGVAKMMVAMKNDWQGTLVCVGQPAEEIGAGASEMVNDKMYERGVPVPDYLFGMHTLPLAAGYISNAEGVRMAGMKAFDVTFQGVGGHGSSPHLAKDPIIMAATAILEYQTVVSRSVSAQSPHVITVASVTAGTTNNIIPATATIKLGLRWFTKADLTAMMEGIKRVNNSIAYANNLPMDSPTVIITDKMAAYPVTNDTALANKINLALEKLIPIDKNLQDRPAWMASEDFPNLVANTKANPVYDFMFVGIANPARYAQAIKEGKEFPFANHNPNFEIDLSAIPFGTMVGATALLEMFRQ